MTSAEIPFSMDDEIVRRLVELNAKFYDQLAAPFSASRTAPQPGYERLLAHLPSDGVLDVLDVGCGNGRFGRFLVASGIDIRYTGIDFSKGLIASSDMPGEYHQRDLSLPGSLSSLGDFDLIACLSTLQHIPGRANRERLMRELRDHLRPDGRLILANWQFLGSPRQRRKLRPWADARFHESQMERGDYLLSWERGGFGLRYVTLIDEEATQSLANAADFRVINHFFSDGREQNLNLYTLMVRE